MTQEGIEKHWEVIKAFHNGKEIEFRDSCEDIWQPATTPTFRENIEYRVKPRFKPNPGDTIIVSNTLSYWEGSRIFVEYHNGLYRCIDLTLDGKFKVSFDGSVLTRSWKYAKP